MKNNQDKVSKVFNKNRTKLRNKRGKSNKKENVGIKETADLKNESPVGNPNWYFTDHGLAEQASRFSFQSFIGNGEFVDRATLPSIMTFYLNPSIGGHVGPTDSTAAVNLCARKLYSQLSNKSGRTAQYAPQDIMTLILAMGEVISYASYLRRAFGLVFTYNQRNRDLPTHLIEAMGINAEDLFANLAPYRVRYNTTLNMANKIPIPANIAWFQKCESVYQGIFTDSPDALAQLYAFVPATSWKINETAYEGGTILETIPVVMSKQGEVVIRTMSSHITTLASMIDALLTSSTYNIIYADILNYASGNNVPLLHMGIVDELYSVVPQYDEEVLLHIHNLSVACPTTNTMLNLEDSEHSLYTPFNDVYPSASNNNLIYMPIIPLLNSTELEEGEMSVLSKLDIVDFPYGDPDLTQRIEATRFSIRYGTDAFNVSGTGGLWIAFSALPDHYCVLSRMYQNGQTVGLTSSLRSILIPASTAVASLAGREKFRHAPIQYRIDGGYTAVESVFGEINYFTHVDAEWLDRLNTLCYQGLFELR
nr:putative capsid [Picobirnavirus sp.]